MLKTWITEDTGPEASIEAVMSATTYFRIKKDRAQNILGEVAAAVTGWREVARMWDVGMTAMEMDPFAASFEHTQIHLAARLANSTFAVIAKTPRLR